MKQFAFSIITAILIIIGNVTLTSCTDTIGDMADGLVNGIADQIVDPKSKPQSKTVLVYMAGRNSLADIVDDDLNEMKQGSKLLGSHDNLLVFVRGGKTEKMPWLARIKNGEVTDSVMP